MALKEALCIPRWHGLFVWSNRLMGRVKEFYAQLLEDNHELDQSIFDLPARDLSTPRRPARISRRDDHKSHGWEYKRSNRQHDPRRDGP
jgi:adenylate cyclase class IV